MASNPHASERGMASSGATGLDVITTGAAGMVPAGWIKRGWVLVVLIAGAAGAGRGKTLMRAVSAPGAAFVWIAGGFGNGCNRGDDAGEAAGVIGGRRGKTFGAWAVDSEEGGGVIFGGNRRMGITGVREGRTMRAVSRFATLGADAACSGRGGSAMRTVSFFGSAMGGRRAIKKVA